METEIPIGIKEVAARLEASVRTVQRWIDKGLPVHKPAGTRLYFYWSEVNRWIKGEEHEGDNADSG